MSQESLTEMASAHRSRMVAKVIFSAAAAVSLLGACSSAPRPVNDHEFTDVASVSARAEQDGATKAVELLKDGNATDADLVKSVVDFRACVEGLGMRLSDPTINPVDGWRRLSDVSYNGVTDPKVQNKAHLCYGSTQGFVEIAYEMTHAGRMDPVLMAGVQSCLTAKRLEVTGTEQNVRDLLQGSVSGSARATSIVACINSKGAQLLPGVSMGIAF